MSMYFNKNGNIDASTIVTNEAYDIEIGGGLIAVQEAYQDIGDISGDVGDFEAKATDHYVAESANMTAFEPVAEGFFGNLYDKIVSAMKKLWEKLKGFFATAVRYFDGLFLSAKKFAEKYEDAIKDKELGGFKFTMHEYDLKAIKLGSIFTETSKSISEKVSAVATASNVAEAQTSAKKKEIASAVMSKICGESVSNSEAYSKALYKKLRKGKTEKREITPNIGEVLSTLKDNEDLSECKDAQSDCDDSFKEAIDRIEDLRKQHKDGSSDDSKNEKQRGHQADLAKLARARHEAFVKAKDIAMTAFSAYKSAVSERDSAYKSCLASALRYKKAGND